MSPFLREALEIARRLVRSPALALPLVLTTVLGVGSLTAAWTAVDAALLTPLPYPDPERLVILWERALDGSAEQVVTSQANFVDWRAQSRSFERLAAFNVWFPSLTGAGIDRPEKLLGAVVADGFFTALGARPLHGRLFVPGEERPGHDVVVLGHDLWRRSFGADPKVVGRAIDLDGQPHTVVGVLAPGFRHPEPTYLTETTELWKPLGLDGDKALRGLRYLRVLGRLRPGVSAAAAQAEMDAIAARLERENLMENEGMGVQVLSLERQLVGDLRQHLLLLLAAAGLVLLVSCANGAGLLLAAASRQTLPSAVRAALGASPALLARRALLESLLPTLAGGALGLVLGVWGARGLLAAGPPLARPVAVALDGRALAVALGTCLLTALLAGLAPALAAAKSDPAAVLAEQGGRSGTGGRLGRRLLALLVAAEAALSLPLLVGTGLLARSLGELAGVPLGLAPDRVLTFRLELPDTRYPGRPEMRAFYGRLLARLSALPEVEIAATTSSLPLTGLFDITREIAIEGAEKPVESGYRTVSPGYFQALGVPLIAGRLADDHDQEGAPAVVVVNESFARAAWPGATAVGRRILLPAATGKTPREVIGVVGDVRHGGPTSDARPEIFLTVLQAPAPFATVVLRTRGEPEAAAGAARAAVREIDPDLALAAVQPMSALVGAALAPARFHGLLAGVLATVGVALALLGLYGTTAFTASGQKREVGIRMALGASRADVLARLLARALLPVALGTLVGLAAALGLAHLLASLLFGVVPRDPTAFVAAPLLLLAAALLAAALPARRAARSDPAEVLRRRP